MATFHFECFPRQITDCYVTAGLSPTSHLGQSVARVQQSEFVPLQAFHMLDHKGEV